MDAMVEDWLSRGKLIQVNIASVFAIPKGLVLFKDLSMDFDPMVDATNDAPNHEPVVLPR